MPSKYEQIGGFFREARLKAGVSQLKIATKLGYPSAQLVSNWERGMCLPPADKLYALSAILDISRKKIVELYLGETKKELERRLRFPTSKVILK